MASPLEKLKGNLWYTILQDLALDDPAKHEAALQKAEQTKQVIEAVGAKIPAATRRALLEVVLTNPLSVKPDLWDKASALMMADVERQPDRKYVSIVTEHYKTAGNLQRGAALALLGPQRNKLWCAKCFVACVLDHGWPTPTPAAVFVSQKALISGASAMFPALLMNAGENLYALAHILKKATDVGYLYDGESYASAKEYLEEVYETNHKEEDEEADEDEDPFSSELQSPRGMAAAARTLLDLIKEAEEEIEADERNFHDEDEEEEEDDDEEEGVDDEDEDEDEDEEDDDDDDDEDEEEEEEDEEDDDDDDEEEDEEEDDDEDDDDAVDFSFDNPLHDIEKLKAFLEKESIPSDIYSNILEICRKADDLAEKENYGEAIYEYRKAWVLLPEPKQKWEAATWILGSMGDACFLGKHFKYGKETMEKVMHCPGAIGNPFIHLRLGQIYFELNQLDQAANELMRAYMGEGEDIFENDDPKYFAFLKTRAKID